MLYSLKPSSKNELPNTEIIFKFEPVVLEIQTNKQTLQLYNISKDNIMHAEQKKLLLLLLLLLWLRYTVKGCKK